jgi:hypothetical protein
MEEGSSATKHCTDVTDVTDRSSATKHCTDATEGRRNKEEGRRKKEEGRKIIQPF